MVKGVGAGIATAKEVATGETGFRRRGSRGSDRQKRSTWPMEHGKNRAGVPRERRSSSNGENKDGSGNIRTGGYQIVSPGAIVSLNTDQLIIRVEGGECLGEIWRCSGGVGKCGGLGTSWGMGTSWGLGTRKHCSVALFILALLRDDFKLVL